MSANLSHTLLPLPLMLPFKKPLPEKKKTNKKPLPESLLSTSCPLVSHSKHCTDGIWHFVLYHPPAVCRLVLLHIRRKDPSSISNKRKVRASHGSFPEPFLTAQLPLCHPASFPRAGRQTGCRSRNCLGLRDNLENGSHPKQSNKIK